MTSIPFRGALGAAVFLLCAPAASAHVTLGVTEASPNAAFRGIVQINHGCEGSPTTRVRVTIPEGVIGVKPMPKPGWSLATTRGPYAKAYPYFHGSVSEGVKEIVWSGGSLPDDAFDEFVFVGRMSDAHGPGETVYLPVVQECAVGAHHWAEIPAAGADPRALKEPAPGIRLVSAAGSAGIAAPATATATATATVTAGPLVIRSPWLRATPGGAKVAGGYVQIANTGTEPDRLVGATIPISGRGEVHASSTEGGVARMAPIQGGLVIRPGDTVELKPGGNHLMFMDLTSGLKQGEAVKGTLVFEKAGPVEVVFRVGGIGAAGPAPAEHQH